MRDSSQATVADFETALQNTVAQAADSQVLSEQHRRRTYLTNELPVRPCTTSCPHRSRCDDFNTGKVLDGELCRPELRQIKTWQREFCSGKLSAMQSDAGAVAGSLLIQIQRLLEAAIVDGVVLEVEKSAGTIRWTEKIVHPALRQAANLMRVLNINLDEFLMTPKSRQDQAPSTQIDIGISPAEVHARFVNRFSGNP